MRKVLRCGALLVMLISSTGEGLAAAGSGCARADDIYALRAAAIQQRLVVAALNCQAADRYNKFVVAYRKDLRASDLALQRFFRRLNGPAGDADYHAFKTRLANASANESADARQMYCASAEATFADALGGKTKSLRIFVSDKPTEAEAVYTPCPVQATVPKRPSRK